MVAVHGEGHFHSLHQNTQHSRGAMYAFANAMDRGKSECSSTTDSGGSSGSGSGSGGGSGCGGGYTRSGSGDGDSAR